jgi:hypothetical protein
MNKFILSIFILIVLCGSSLAAQQTGYLKECIWSINDPEFNPWNYTTSTGTFMKINNSNQEFDKDPKLNWFTLQEDKIYYNSSGVFPYIKSYVPMINIESKKDSILYIKCDFKFGNSIVTNFGSTFFFDQHQGTYFTPDFNLSNIAIEALANKAEYDSFNLAFNETDNKITYIKNPRAWTAGYSLPIYIKINENIIDEKEWIAKEKLSKLSIAPNSEGTIIEYVNLTSYPSGISTAYLGFSYSNAASIFSSLTQFFYINSTKDTSSLFLPVMNSSQIKITLKDSNNGNLIYDDYPKDDYEQRPIITNETNITYTLPLYNPYKFDISGEFMIYLRQFHQTHNYFGDIGMYGNGNPDYEAKTLELGATNFINVTLDLKQGENVNVTVNYTLTQIKQNYNHFGIEVFMKRPEWAPLIQIGGNYAVARDGQKYLGFLESYSVIQYNPLKKKFELNVSQSISSFRTAINKNEFAIDAIIYKENSTNGLEKIETQRLILNDSFFSLKGITSIPVYPGKIKHDFIFPIQSSYSIGTYRVDLESVPIYTSHKFYNHPVADLSGTVKIYPGKIAFQGKNNLTVNITKPQDTDKITLVNPTFQPRVYNVTLVFDDGNFIKNITNKTSSNEKNLVINMPLFSTVDINLSTYANYIPLTSWTKTNLTSPLNVTIKDITSSLPLDEILSPETLEYNVNTIAIPATPIANSCKDITNQSILLNISQLTCANKTENNMFPYFCHWNTTDISKSSDGTCIDCPTSAPSKCDFYNEKFSCELMSCGEPTNYEGIENLEGCGWVNNKCYIIIDIDGNPVTTDDICLFDNDWNLGTCDGTNKYKEVTYTSTGLNSTGSTSPKCQEKTKEYKVICPSYTELPIYNTTNLIISMLVIYSIYFISRKKN